MLSAEGEMNVGCKELEKTDKNNTTIEGEVHLWIKYIDGGGDHGIGKPGGMA